MFFFNDTATTEIYTLSLHDALPIFDPSGLSWASSTLRVKGPAGLGSLERESAGAPGLSCWQDRKSTRLNSSHANISYAVFCLKKKTSPLYIPLADHD